MNECAREDSCTQHDIEWSWESTVSGEYWNLEVSKKHPTNFYDGNVRMSIRELLQVFKQMGLLKAEVDINHCESISSGRTYNMEERRTGRFSNLLNFNVSFLPFTEFTCVTGGSLL
jgi:hypothetical protein